MRKIATFEIVDGNLIQEHLWGYDEEEEVDFFLESSGYDSNLFQFVLSLPLYIFGYSAVLLVALVPFNWLSNKFCRTL
jgi:hypothetical protein